MTRLGQRVPVEPLDDKRVARLEDRVLTSFRAMPGDSLLAPDSGSSWLQSFGRSMQRLSPAIAVAAVIVAVYLGVRSSGPDPAAPLEPARITSSGDGTSTVDLGDAVCTITADTSIAFDRQKAEESDSTRSEHRAEHRAKHRAEHRAITFELTRGQIDCEVEPRANRAAVVVNAGDVAVTVVGTVFQVRRDDMVHVSVSRGKVRVDVAGESHDVAAGESWSGAAIIAEAPAAAAVDDIGGLRRAGPGRDGPGSEAAKKTSDHGEHETARASGSTGATVRDTAAGDRRSVALDTDAESAKLRGKRTSRRPDSTRSTRPNKGPAVKGKDQRSRALRKARPARGNPASSSAVSSELSEAMGLERSDPEAAIALYRKLSLQRGPEAEFALYSLAYVHYFMLRDNRAALQSLDHYQRRFSRGAHRESALWLRVRILCEGDDTEACRAAAHTYLNRFPDGRHARMAQDIINWDM